MAEVRLNDFSKIEGELSAKIIVPWSQEYNSMYARPLEKKRFRVPFRKKLVEVYTVGMDPNVKDSEIDWSQPIKPITHTLIEKGEFRTLKKAMESGRQMLEKQLTLQEEIDRIAEM